MTFALRTSPLARVARLPLLGAAAFALALTVGCDEDDQPFRPADAAASDAADAARPADTASVDGAASDVADAGIEAGGDAVGTADASSADGSADAGEAAPPPADHDLAVVRLNADGTVDTTFGTNGIVRIDLGPGAGTTRDNVWGLARDAMDRLVLFGSKKAEGRSDADRVVVRLAPNGTLDSTFATMGVHSLNVANLPDNPRHGLVQADGKILAAGYTAQPTGVGTQTANKIVLLRLGESGMPDATFGSMGVVNSLPFAPTDPNMLWGFAEAYGIAQQGDKYVTAGYGKALAATPTVDVVAFRFNANGSHDATFGTNGSYILDLVGQNDRGRNITVLPDNRVLIVGSGGTSMTAIDALAAVLTPDGKPDTTFDTDGHKLFDLGKPDDAFFGVAVSPDKNWVAAVGHSAGGTDDDDAALLLMPIAAGQNSGAAAAKVVPLADADHDRFLAVTFDAANKAVAAGYVAAGSDQQFAVARYNADGTPDTTFGTGGVAKVNVVAAGRDETARGVVVQSDGKIVIAGVAERP